MTCNLADVWVELGGYNELRRYCNWVYKPLVTSVAGGLTLYKPWLGSFKVNFHCHESECEQNEYTTQLANILLRQGI